MELLEIKNYQTLEQSIQDALYHKEYVRYRQEGDNYIVAIDDISFMLASYHCLKDGSMMEDLSLYRRNENLAKIGVSFTNNEAEGLKFHRHEYYEIIYMMYGEMIHILSNQTIRLKKGEALLLNPYILHKEIVKEDALAFYIECPVDLMEEMLQRCQMTSNKNALAKESELKKEYMYFFSKRNKGIQSLVDYLLEELMHQKPGRSWMTMGITERLIGTLMNQEDSVTLFSEKFHQSTEVFKEIENWLEIHNWNLNQEEVAEKFHYNKNYISHLLKKYTGMSYVKYCMEHKLCHAEYLLKHSDMSINDIIVSLGYQNKTFFYDKFKQKYGKTPQELRMIYKKVN